MNHYTQKYSMHAAASKNYAGLRRQLRARHLLKALDPQASDTILEIGSNDAFLLSTVQQFCARCTGIDINNELIQQLNNPHLLFMDAQKMTFNDNSFSKIFSSHTFEHIPDIRAALNEACRVLKQHGNFVLIFPWELFRGQSAIKDSIHVYGHPFHCRQLHQHHLTPKVIRRLTADLPLKIIKTNIALAPFPDFVIVMKKCTDGRSQPA